MDNNLQVTRERERGHYLFNIITITLVHHFGQTYMYYQEL